MNFIVRESSLEIKNISKKRLEGYWVKVTIAMVIYAFLTDVMPYILTMISPDSLIVTVEEVSASYLATLYEVFTMSAFLVGLTSFFLMFFRHKETNPGYLFNGFGYYFKSLGLMIVTGFFAFLWSLLFVIPGIIAAFSYSQVFYILADNPEKGIMQCIKESKAMMNGNKMKLFMLLLSFIGWFFALSFAQSLLLYTDVNVFIIDLIFLVPAAALSGYVGLAQTVFYEIASGHLKGKTEVDFDVLTGNENYDYTDPVTGNTDDNDNFYDEVK